jgi:predicted CoA-binding protein
MKGDEVAAAFENAAAEDEPPARQHETTKEPRIESLVEEFINERVWAVVGASTDPDKFGHRIFYDLRAAGYTVYGVNPPRGRDRGQKLYPALSDLPEKPAVVDIVVPPRVTEEIVRQCAQLGLKRVWMQPGSESEAAISLCQKHDMRVVHSVCPMIEKRRW